MRCDQCGTTNPPASKFCNECGNRLAQAPPPEAERRRLTVLFCDLVGSTALSEALDPEELSEVIHAYHAACTAVVRRFGGHVAQLLGDGILVYFGFPVAHEDDVRRAVRTGLAAVAAVSKLETRAGPIHARVGIHTGPVVVGEVGGVAHREHLALGETPNLAAWVEGEAAPDTVAISEATLALVRPFFEVEELGPRTLKGISTPMLFMLEDAHWPIPPRSSCSTRSSRGLRGRRSCASCPIARSFAPAGRRTGSSTSCV